jgi:hypothetical protein
MTPEQWYQDFWLRIAYEFRVAIAVVGLLLIAINVWLGLIWRALK